MSRFLLKPALYAAALFTLAVSFGSAFGLQWLDLGFASQFWIWPWFTIAFGVLGFALGWFIVHYQQRWAGHELSRFDNATLLISFVVMGVMPFLFRASLFFPGWLSQRVADNAAWSLPLIIPGALALTVTYILHQALPVKPSRFNKKALAQQQVVLDDEDTLTSA